MSDWQALHAYNHGDADYNDRFLLEAVAPVARAAVANGAASGWFFIRYWEGGPHLRLRLADAPPETVDSVAGQLTGWLLAHPVESLTAESYYGAGWAAAVEKMGWHEHGEVTREPYEPEVTRYGGPDAIGLAEEFFQLSSEISTDLVAAAPKEAQRRGTAFNLLIGSLAATKLDRLFAVSMLRWYVIRWSDLPEAPGVDTHTIVGHAERGYAAAREHYLKLTGKITDRVEAGDLPPTILGRWVGALQRYWQQLSEVDNLALPAWQIVVSQLHMLHNRAGIAVPDELSLAWTASLAVASATMGEGFHDIGADSPSHRYHEASKFYAGTLSEQVPRRSATKEPRHPRPDDEIVLLSPVDDPLLPHERLVEVLRARRSGYGVYAGKLAESDLSTLLHEAANRQGAVHTTVGETHVVYPVAPYPSPGAWFPTRLIVYPHAVVGIEPRLYEYLPEDHGLRVLRETFDVAALQLASPYLDPAGVGTVQAADAPLWLFLTADIRALESRYGQRAYRFICQEVGHLAQNIALLATAMNYKLLTIGGFFDDAVGQLVGVDGATESVFSIIPIGAQELVSS